MNTTAPAPTFLGEGRIEFLDHHYLDPGAGMLQLGVQANAICGTDRAQYFGGSAVTPGHEAAGIVIAAGEGTSTAIGTRGVVFLMDYCGECRSCRLGATNQCLAKRADMGFTHDGGYGRFETVHETNFFPVDGKGWVALGQEPTRNNGLWFITGGSYHPLQDKTTLENFATNTDTYGPEPVQALDQPHLYNVSGQNGSWASWINGSLYLSKSTNTVPTFSAAAQLGWNGYGGDIAEIIIYDHALTAAEREVVGRYLNQRHAFVPAVPANPTNLTAQALASTQVNLSWSAALTGKGTIFTVERRTGTDPFAPVADVADSLSFIDATAASDMTYTYRVTARNLAGASGYSNEASATTATSGGVAMPLTGIRLWLKADAIASTGPVGTWLDQSGNRNHGTQLNAVFQPQVIANALNGRPVVRFDGANDVFNLSPAMMAGATEGEVLVVLKTAAAALPGDNGLWYFGGTDGNYYPLTDGTTIETFGTTVAYTGPVPAQPLNQYHLYNVSAQAGAWMSSLNGVPYVVQSTNTVTFGASAPTLGRGHNFFSGDIAEIIVYDHALSATERETAERYFNQRYQLTPSPFTAVNDFAYDSDGDGLSNAYELAHGLNPYNRDSDGDGIPDGWEIAHGLNPLDPSDALQLGANGLTNLENYYNDTGTTGASVKLKVFQPAQR